METAAAPSAPAQTSAPQASPESVPSGGTSQSGKQSAPSAASETYELKVNGQTKRLSRDELIKQAQLGYSAHERFEQAAQQKKQMESVVGRFKDPNQMIDALMDPSLGLTKDQVRTAMEAWYTREFIEPEQMTPEQLELRNAREKLKKYEDSEKTKQKEQQDAEFEALTTRERETVQVQITDALDASGLPKTKFIVARMAFYMHKNLSNGWDAPMEVIIDQVKKERQSMLSDLTESSDAEALISYLGKDFVNKIRKYDLAQLRARKNGGVNSDDAIRTAPRQSKTEEESGPISYREVNRKLRNIMQGK